MRDADTFLNLVKHPVKFRMFLFSRLPAAFFSGVRVREIDTSRCVVTVPYKWLTQNPFKSTYFASLSMAAEMSTGVLAMAHLYKLNPPVSMLVVKVESGYFKKAVARTTFTCEDGDAIREAIATSIATGEGTVFMATSTGRNPQGEVVAVFHITWSFRVKSSK